MIYRSFLYCLTFLFLLAPLSAQAINLEKHARQFLDSSGAPGVEISIMRKGETLPQSIATGTTCVENNVPMNKETVLKVGSLTKLFTGLRIQMLIDEGKFDNDTPMAKFFPDFPNAGQITIRHLLTHTSGLPEMLMLEPLHSDFAHPWTPQQILSMVAKAPLDFAPGTAAAYSNSGFLVLGMIIEKLTGSSYAQEIVNTIAIPLHMSALYAGDDTTIIPRQGCGYSKNGKGKLCKPMLASMIPPFATGNLLMRAMDLVRLVNLEMLSNNTPLSKQLTKIYVLKNGKQAYKYEKFLDMTYDKCHAESFFIWRFTDRPLTLLGKLGAFPGYTACFFYDPQTLYAVAVTTNLETATMQTMRTAVKILEEIRVEQTLNRPPNTEN